MGDTLVDKIQRDQWTNFSATELKALEKACKNRKKWLPSRPSKAPARKNTWFSLPNYDVDTFLKDPLLRLESCGGYPELQNSCTTRTSRFEPRHAAMRLYLACVHCETNASRYQTSYCLFSLAMYKVLAVVQRNKLVDFLIAQLSPESLPEQQITSSTVSVKINEILRVGSKLEKMIGCCQNLSGVILLYDGSIGCLMRTNDGKLPNLCKAVTENQTYLDAAQRFSNRTSSFLSFIVECVISTLNTSTFRLDLRQPPANTVDRPQTPPLSMDVSLISDCSSNLYDNSTVEPLEPNFDLSVPYFEPPHHQMNSSGHAEQEAFNQVALLTSFQNTYDNQTVV